MDYSFSILPSVLTVIFFIAFLTYYYFFVRDKKKDEENNADQIQISNQLISQSKSVTVVNRRNTQYIYNIKTLDRNSLNTYNHDNNGNNNIIVNMDINNQTNMDMNNSSRDRTNNENHDNISHDINKYNSIIFEDSEIIINNLFNNNNNNNNNNNLDNKEINNNNNNNNNNNTKNATIIDDKNINNNNNNNNNTKLEYNTINFSDRPNIDALDNKIIISERNPINYTQADITDVKVNMEEGEKVHNKEVDDINITIPHTKSQISDKVIEKDDQLSTSKTNINYPNSPFDALPVYKPNPNNFINNNPHPTYTFGKDGDKLDELLLLPSRAFSPSQTINLTMDNNMEKDKKDKKNEKDDSNIEKDDSSMRK